MQYTAAGGLGSLVGSGTDRSAKIPGQIGAPTPGSIADFMSPYQKAGNGCDVNRI